MIDPLLSEWLQSFIEIGGKYASTFPHGGMK